MMKKKVFMSSVLTIAICLCLIAGSTFALFTSEVQTDVAITAATVKLVATIDRTSLEYKSELIGGVLDESGAVINGNVVDVKYMVPGDYFTFDILVDNQSNVTVDYRTLLSVVEDGGLWGGLVVSYSVNTSDGVYPQDPTAYAELAPNQDVVVTVKVALPHDRGNEYQNTGCRFAINVEAIQGNAQ